jgi:cell division septation protein DedD
MFGCSVVALAASEALFEGVDRTLRTGDRGEAARMLENALPRLSDEERAHALFLLATLTPDGSVSAERCREALKAARTSVWAGLALVQLGDAALLSGDPVGAFAFFEEAAPLLREDELRARALIRSAQALLQMDRPAEARRRLDPMLARLAPGPLQDEVAIVVATCDYQEGRYSDALKRCLDLVRAGSALEPSALLMAANCLVARGEFVLARQYLEELASGFPHTAEGAIGRGTADSLRAMEESRTAASTPVDSAGTSTELAEAAGSEGAVADSSTQRSESGLPLYVELGRFEDRVEALSLLSRVRRKGVEQASLLGSAPGEEKLFRVRVGPFDTRAEAHAELERLESLLQVKGTVTEGP